MFDQLLKWTDIMFGHFYNVTFCTACCVEVCALGIREIHHVNRVLKVVDFNEQLALKVRAETENGLPL